jgi:hypothetical protein
MAAASPCPLPAQTVPNLANEANEAFGHRPIDGAGGRAAMVITGFSGGTP